MSLMRSQLEAGKFTVTAEIGPLKGTDTSEIWEVAEILHGKVAAANVTDQQSAVMRLGVLATCHLALDAGLERFDHAPKEPPPALLQGAVAFGNDAPEVIAEHPDEQPWSLTLVDAGSLEVLRGHEGLGEARSIQWFSKKNSPSSLPRFGSQLNSSGWWNE